MGARAIPQNASAEQILAYVKKVSEHCCMRCSYDEAEGALTSHCDNCCRQITKKVWELAHRAIKPLSPRKKMGLSRLSPAGWMRAHRPHPTLKDFSELQCLVSDIPLFVHPEDPLHRAAVRNLVKKASKK